MNWLVIVCDGKLRAHLVDSFPAGTSQIVFAGKSYQAAGSGYFFEWLFDSRGEVTGVELCITPDKTLLSTLLLCAGGQVDSTDLFPRIWFGTTSEGSARSLQDWEDYYYRSHDDSMLIALRTHLLSKEELMSLAANAHKPEGT